GIITFYRPAKILCLLSLLTLFVVNFQSQTLDSGAFCLTPLCFGQGPIRMFRKPGAAGFRADPAQQRRQNHIAPEPGVVHLFPVPLFTRYLFHLLARRQQLGPLSQVLACCRLVLCNRVHDLGHLAPHPVIRQKGKDFRPSTAIPVR
ncbi:MAG: hypothetical protein M0P55_12010, partial [Clostridiales bacterium]|nr:hypothetical protein [Clostridiales bacterium]